MEKVLIIAEAGVNHNGSLQLARELVDIACEAGVDIVKFQAFKTEQLVTKFAEQAGYQKESCDASSQFEMLKSLELSFSDHENLVSYCAEKKIKYLASPFDLESIDEVARLGVDVFKIPSGEITNFPYLKLVASYRKKVILSTGMANLSEIVAAVDVLVKFGVSRNNISVLHCNTEYPTPMCDVNLLAMQTLKEELGLTVGYSDHTKGIEVSIAAVALGAKIIEKHFTIDKSMVGPDHAASLSPSELKEMVLGIRNIEMAIGTSLKAPSKSEIKNITAVRKSIVALKDIQKGELLTSENITVKRPGNGISPMLWETVLGTESSLDFKKDELIVL